MWGWEVRKFLFGTWRSSSVPFPTMQSLRKRYHLEGKAFFRSENLVYLLCKTQYSTRVLMITIANKFLLNWFLIYQLLNEIPYFCINSPCKCQQKKQSPSLYVCKIDLTISSYFFLMISIYQKAWFQPPKCKTSSWPITAIAHMSMLLSIMFNFFELLSHYKYNRVAFQYCLYRASIHNYASRPNKPSVIYYLSCS